MFIPEKASELFNSMVVTNVLSLLRLKKGKVKNPALDNLSTFNFQIKLWLKTS
jgi:hypothetical protein